MLESGADIEKKDSKYQGTALLWAAYAKQSAVCRILIDGGAERDVVNVEGQSPLDLLGDDAESAEWQRLFKQTRRKRGRVSDVVTNPNPKKLKITAVSPSTSADLTPSSAGLNTFKRQRTSPCLPVWESYPTIRCSKRSLTRKDSLITP